MEKTRYMVQCNVHLFTDQINRLKKLKKHTDTTRNDVLRVAVDDVLKNKTDKELAAYVRERIDGEKDI